MPRPLRGLRILYPRIDIVDPHATKLAADYGFKVAPLGHIWGGSPQQRVVNLPHQYVVRLAR